jgi:UDP-3-O-[3-hydroxymyristoyl] N-acetylglucosamine deacetylase
MKQRTLKNRIEFSGIGLHSGANVSVRMLPSEADSGITFLRTDLKNSVAIKAVASSVIDTSYATTIGRHGATVSTIEHMMAALYCMGVDNVLVELDGPEVPIMDGSSAPIAEMISSIGTMALNKQRKYIVIKNPIRIEDGGKHIHLLPSGKMELDVDYGIDFSHKFLTKQSFSESFSRDLFVREVLGARTFGFLRDVEMLRANGLAKGGSLDNAVVVGDDGVLNAEGLRFPDEFVRHKVLDLIGDLALLGAPVIGSVAAYRSGHTLNHMLVRKTLKNTARWEYIEKPFFKSALRAEERALLDEAFVPA